jgi:N-acetylneuraminic acid mutarotase
MNKNTRLSTLGLLIGLSTLLWQCGLPVAPLIELQKGQWTELKAKDGSLPKARHEAAFVGVGDRFYLMGGRRIQPVSIYDVKKQKWSDGSPPPIELHHFQAVVYQEEIYIVGAMTGKYPAETPVPNMYIYNPKEDSWRLGPAIPADRQRGGAGVAIVDDVLYLVCGIKDGHRGDHKKWLDRYDLNQGTWEQLPDAPRARDHFQVQIVDHKIYNLGGRTTIAQEGPFKNTITAVDVYDIKKDSWSTLANDLPTPRAGNFSIILGPDILVLGGESAFQNPAHNEVEVLDTRTGEWHNLPDLPQGRHGTGVVLYDQKLYTASGSGNRGGGPELTDLWFFSYKKEK